MYSDDDGDAGHFGGGREDDGAWGRPANMGHRKGRRSRSRSAELLRGNRSRSRSGQRNGRTRGDTGRSRSRGRGDKGKGKGRQRTTGTQLPPLFSIHKGTIVSVQAYGAFVRLGDGSEYKDGLLHVSRLSAVGRVEQVEDVASVGDCVFVKVVEVRDEEGKYSLDMRHVGQKDGEDKDPNNVQIDAGGSKGKGGGKADPIRIGAVQATTCSRCGARGHSARECFAGAGSKYDLVADEPMQRADIEREEHAERLQDPKASKSAKVIKAALKAMIKRSKGDDGSSSSSSSSNSESSSAKEKKHKKKANKKEKKLLKKQIKKEKKEQKKKIKELKKQIKEAKQSKNDDKEDKDANEKEKGKGEKKESHKATDSKNRSRREEKHEEKSKREKKEHRG
eukprot:TRINITY_DN7275_c0_g1_i1.p1 TRINITY_DN7275_c0_g1~~TRINITY_DN7275_c0_g1_i1.p1  ORF type:complete len:393 (-),score=90.58 TRINITY_DN7275_c0_g1_i1:195-1373(-)